MTSFFPFYSSPSNPSSSQTRSQNSASSTHLEEKSNLEVTVTPAASAFYAGETFSVTITFRNTRTPTSSPAHTTPPTTGTSTVNTASTAASSTRQLPNLQHAPNEPRPIPPRRRQIGLDLQDVAPDGNAEAGPSRITSPLGSTSEAATPYSPGANPAYRATGWPAPQSPQRDSPMNFRSPEGWGQKEYGDLTREVPGHTRRARSLALGKGTMSPQELIWALGGQPTPPPLPPRRPGGAPIPSHHPHSRQISISNGNSSPPPDETRLHSRPTLIRLNSSASDLGFETSSNSTSASAANNIRSPRRPQQRASNSRAPSFHNAYGASSMRLDAPALPPPTHPYIRDHPPAGGTLTILWAYTQLAAHFHPSNTYIPPDPLLPLRSLLLHQPVGSGSFSTDPKASRGVLSFGTGTIGNSTQPSLTGSLFGLAKDLVYGGSGGSLEEERKRVWNMKDLPVLETTRSLLGIDLKLEEGESRAFTYTLQLPACLPPTYHGKAFRFSYDLAVSLNIMLPGPAHVQRSKTITVPIRVWANVNLANPVQSYDVLRPIIQTNDQAIVADGPKSPVNSSRRSSIPIQWNSQDSLKAYAAHLVGHSCSSVKTPREIPLSPSRIRTNLPVESSRKSSSRLEVHASGQPSNNGNGEDHLNDDAEGGCGEAVEVLSRHSAKTSYDITKDGEDVAVVTLIKTTYRLGETVLGVVTLNGPNAARVLKFSAFLESHEIIPERLQPPPDQTHQPTLFRSHAEHRSAYAVTSARLSFSLDIPSDATPAFGLSAGEGGAQGGLEWRIRLNFLVTMSKRREKGLHLIGSGEVDDPDNRHFSAADTMEGVVSPHSHRAGESRRQGYDLKTEMVECVVPVQVLAGNTAFVVRPSTWAI